MRKPEEWRRTFEEIPEQEFVPVPSYDLRVLTSPLAALLAHRTEENERKLTAKLYYSTRHFGSYDLDAGEGTGDHPGVDLKLAMGTPVRAIAGGKVRAVRDDPRLGLHVLIEHRVPGEGSLVSIYGHLSDVTRKEGEKVQAGDVIGTVGLTGSTRQPHLHLQVDRKRGEGVHIPYWPMPHDSLADRASFSLNPLTFIHAHAVPLLLTQTGESRAGSAQDRGGRPHAAASTPRASGQGSQRSALQLARRAGD